MLSPSSQDSDENPMWLRQKGSVKEFNALFDDATSNIQLPERYLVMTYMAGLKKQIADSVRLFQPRTMCEARSLARVQEISLQWQAKKVAKARRVLKEQEDDGVLLPSIPEQPTIIQEASKIQESGGWCSTNSQEEEKAQLQSRGPQEDSFDHKALDDIQEDDEVLEASDLEQETESHGEAQVTLYATRQNDDTKRSCGVIELSTTTEKTNDTKDIYQCEILGPTQSAASATGAMEEVTQKDKEPKMNSGRSGFPMHELLTIFHTPKKWKNAKVAYGVSGSFSLVCFLPLSSFSSSLALFLLFGQRTLSSNSYVGVSKSMVSGLWSVQKFTWLTKDDLEQSYIQLDTTLCQLQKYLGGLQLDSISSLCQEYFGDTLGLVLSDQNMGFIFQELGPRLFLQCCLPNRPTTLYHKWAFHLQYCTTRGLVSNWFKGKLVKMLQGSGLVQSFVYLI